MRRAPTSLLKGIKRQAVGACIERGGKVLIVRRKKDDFLGGFFEMPGGSVERGETLEQALRREVKEETGLAIASIEGYLGYFDYTSELKEKTRQFNFLVHAKPPARVRLSEHDKHAWVEKRDLKRYEMSEKVRRAVEAETVSRPDNTPLIN